MSTPNNLDLAIAALERQRRDCQSEINQAEKAMKRIDKALEALRVDVKPRKVNRASTPPHQWRSSMLVLAWMQQPERITRAWTAKEIDQTHDLGYSRSAISHALGALADHGDVVRVEEGIFRIPGAAQSLVDAPKDDEEGEEDETPASQLHKVRMRMPMTQAAIGLLPKLPTEFRASDLERRMAYSPSAVRQVLSTLTTAGKIRRVALGVYTVNANGKVEAEAPVRAE